MKIPWKFIFTHYFILRILTLGAAILGLQLLPFKASFPYSEIVLEPFGSSLFWSWANFDGVHYLMLSQDGYIFGLTQAFFPFYVLLIRWGMMILNNRLLVALLISHLAFLGALVMFYKLIRLDFSAKIAKNSLLFLVYFPTSFFFFSVYTESIFLLFLLASFYLSRIGLRNWSGITGIALTATRIVGIFIIPSFLYELWQQFKHRKQKITISQIFWALIPILGLLAYMFYLYRQFNDPLLFAHVQEGFGAGRDTSKLVLPYQVVWRYIRMVTTVETHSWLYFTIWLEFASTLIFAGLLVLAFLKKIRPSYIIFSALAMLLPTLTGTFSSMPRYVLVAFPTFMVLGLIKFKFLRWTILTISIILLILCTALFTRGYWIA